MGKSMHDTEEIRKALFKLAENFTTYYQRKEYRTAKNCYDTALTVAMFVGLNQEDMLKLFGDRDTGRAGMFSENVVQRVFYFTSVKGDMDRGTETYEEFLLRQRRITLSKLYAKK